MAPFLLSLGHSHVQFLFFKILAHVFQPCLCLSSSTPYVPSTWQYNALAHNLFSSSLITGTWPNHVSLRFRILSTSVSLCPNSFRITSLQVISHLFFSAGGPDSAFDNTLA